MTRLVAFLKGINVGGHHIVAMERLKGIFEGLGFKDVSTYKQSGNVVFDAGRLGPEATRKRVEGALSRELGYEVAVFVRTTADLAAIVRSAPKIAESEVLTFLVTLLPEPLNRFPLRLPMTIPKSSAELLAAEGAQVYSVTRGGGDSALPNPFLEAKLGLKATTRNINVIREIVERFGAGA